MARRASFAAAALLGLFILTAAAPVWAQQQRRGITGDWQLTMQVNDRPMVSILSLSRGKENQLTGKWITFFGVSELKDIKYEGGKLEFVQVTQFGDQERTSTFSGTVEQDKLTGTLKGEMGEFAMEGKRMPRMPRVVGNWDMKVKMGEREFTAVLAVRADKEGKLTAEWQSSFGKHEISDVAYEMGTLTFKRKSTIQENTWESTFEGTIKDEVLTGKFTSERGEATAEGKRAGAAAIGKWELKTTTDQGSRTQMLMVQPDMSGLYGPLPVEKVVLDGDKVSFKVPWTFGDQTGEISFTGKIEGEKLTGEVTSPRGTRAVEGRKLPAEQPRMRGGQGGQAAQAVQEPPKEERRPDVVFVPTPQRVVDKMLEMAKVTKNDLVYDLGCGDGRIVVTAAKKYGCKAVGFDIATERVRESRDNVAKEGVGNLVQIEQADIFTLDLSAANVVTLYLLPGLNVKLIPQLEKLKPGCRIVSHDFDMRGVTPDEVVTLDAEGDEYGDHTIYLWTTPLKKETEKK